MMNPLIVTGSAPCTREDIAAAIGVIAAAAMDQMGLAPEARPACRCFDDRRADQEDLGLLVDFMAVGLDAVHLYRWRIKYVSTFHPVEIPDIVRRRSEAGGNADFEIISHEQKPGVRICIPGDQWWKPSGSSALLGVQAAIERLGYARIILAGCPLRGRNHDGNDYWQDFSAGWIAHRNDLGNRVRSMSGWTREFLGGPTASWLLEDAS
jgi:hypothetical protein